VNHDAFIVLFYRLPQNKPINNKWAVSIREITWIWKLEWIETTARRAIKRSRRTPLGDRSPQIERSGVRNGNKNLIRRWDSEHELSLRRHCTRTTKYNRLLHKFRHRSFSATQVYQIQWNNAMYAGYRFSKTRRQYSCWNATQCRCEIATCAKSREGNCLLLSMPITTTTTTTVEQQCSPSSLMQFTWCVQSAIKEYTRGDRR